MAKTIEELKAELSQTFGGPVGAAMEPPLAMPPLSFNPADKVKAAKPKKAKQPKPQPATGDLAPWSQPQADPDPTSPIPVPSATVAPGVNLESIADNHGQPGAALNASTTVGVITVALPADLWARLCKPPVGTGGWQTLMATLRAHTSPDQPVIYLPSAIYAQVAERAVAGAGGYQSVARHLICLSVHQSLKSHPTPNAPEGPF